jgi:quinol monooxygenase YgiN
VACNPSHLNAIGEESEVNVIGKVVRLAVSLTINEGQTEAFNSIAKAMTEGSKSEPGTLGYEWFADVGSKRFTLLETYVDAAAVEAHFMGPVVQQWVPKLAAVCSVNGFEIFGDPGPKVAAMAAGFGAVILKYWMGIER